MSENDYRAATLRIGGETKLVEGQEFTQGDEFYVVGRIRVNEISFPLKGGVITRVHKGKMTRFTVIPNGEAAEALIAKSESERTGQLSIYNEQPDGFVVNAEPVASMHNGTAPEVEPKEADYDPF